MSRSKQIGTSFESSIVRWVAEGMREHLLPPPNGVRRMALAGKDDEGDVLVCLRDGRVICIEAKAGKAAEGASRGQIVRWVDEAEVEAKNVGASRAFLVTKRAGVGEQRASQWGLHFRAPLPHGEIVMSCVLGDLPTLLGLGRPL